MKVEHYVLVFFVLIFTVFFFFSLKISNLKAVDNSKIEYNRNCDSAVDAAVSNLVDVVDDNDVSINLEACSTNFYKSLFAAFDLLDSKTGQATMEMYIPVILVTDEDGFYINYHSFAADGSTAKKQWSSKMPYTYSGRASNGKKFIVNVTMRDTITLSVQCNAGNYVTYSNDYSKIANNSYEPTRKFSDADRAEFRETVNALKTDGFLKNDEIFEAFKQSTMQYQISKKMAYYINHHNSIAEEFGINYKFSLPVNSTDEIARAITGISVLAVIQGLPYTNGSEDTYERFAFGGAKIVKKSRYYVASVDSISYYHRATCKKITISGRGYTTQKECARLGVLPCPYCNP